VPVVIPVAMPVPTPIVACAVLLLVHVPPPVASVSIVVEPTHTFVVPPIGAGNGLTVIGDDVIHPLPDV
jgi:hypothetical protein